MDIVIRSVVSILVLFAMTRILGKKQLSQLTFFDYAVGITMGSIAGTFAVDETIPFSHGITALVICGLFPIAFSFIVLNSINGRRIIEGKPTILIQNGKIIEKSLKKVRFSINDVLEECRLKGAYDISNVEYAILETSGKVSILLKPEFQPATPKVMKIKVNCEGLPANLIIDGKIMYEHLKLIKHDEKWLIDELKKQNVASPKDVLLACLNSDGRLYIDLKDKDPIIFNVLE